MSSNPQAVRIVVDVDGFCFVSSDGVVPSTTVPWTSVESIVAYKKDCYTIDQIE